MKFNRWLFIILSLSVSKMFASECEQVSKVPCTHTPVWQSFSLSDVKLTSGIFKGAMDLHKGYLLSLDVDRLIPHVRRNVGLTGKNENYGGWETHGGCTYGHYMSACAMMYASTGEKIFRDRLEYMMDELKECQQQTQDGWFISGEVKLEYGKKEYIRLPDSIKSGDTIKIVLPRKLSVRYAKDEPHFGSIMYGPILLAGELGTVVPGSDRVSDNRGLRKELPAQNIPALVGSLADLDEWIIKDSASPLHFTVKNEGKQKDVSLIPYFRMHHQYHTVYWKIYSPDEYAYRRKVLTDVVKIGDEASEKEHQLQGRNDSVYWHDFFWARNARYRMAGDGGWFSYSLAIDKKERNPYYLICRYWGDEPDTHVFDIYVDDKYLETVHLNRKLYLTYVDDVYKIPEAWTHNKSHVNVSFRAKEGKRAGGLYELKITADPDYR